MVVLILILLGLALGSFINALVWRLHQQAITKNKDKSKYSIKNGRSMCVHCGHRLSALDLIPVISWLLLHGKCRYCHQSISWQYPLVEVATSILFVSSYVFWPEAFDLGESFVFGAWLLILTGLIALVIYDIRWMLLPNKIVLPLIYFGGFLAVAESLAQSSFSPITGATMGAIAGGGLFYILFQMSGGKWIGGGDVKLGFLMGIILGSWNLAFLAIFMSSFFGAIFSLPLMLSGRLKRTTRIPFGPFLVVSTIVVYLFGQSILDWYVNLVI